MTLACVEIRRFKAIDCRCVTLSGMDAVSLIPSKALYDLSISDDCWSRKSAEAFCYLSTDSPF
ncbi:hypothetical protein O9929_21510 [Vibrio lentus]|nr:hypothetical protein [Vibrio lentus]